MINKLSVNNYNKNKYELFHEDNLIAKVTIKNDQRFYNIINFDKFDQLNDFLIESNQKLDSIIIKLEENFILDLTA